MRVVLLVLFKLFRFDSKEFLAYVTLVRIHARNQTQSEFRKEKTNEIGQEVV